MLAIKYTVQMKQGLKLMVKRGKNPVKLTKVLDILAKKQNLPKEYRDHQLKGNFKGYRECHIEPDWLLIYKINTDELILLATATGTHADLFKM